MRECVCVHAQRWFEAGDEYPTSNGLVSRRAGCGKCKNPAHFPLGQDFQASRFNPSSLLLSIKASLLLADFLRAQTPQTYSLSIIYVPKCLKEGDATGNIIFKKKISLKLT